MSQTLTTPAFGHPSFARRGMPRAEFPLLAKEGWPKAGVVRV